MIRFFLIGSVSLHLLVSGWSPSDGKVTLEGVRNAKVLVVGGSGRVGGSCVTHLAQLGAKVTVGGTLESNFVNSRDRWLKMFPRASQNLEQVSFVSLDRENPESVKEALASDDFDLVIHTAGPFQGKVKAPNGVLEAAIDTGVAYADVCDDYCTATAAKTRYHDKAIQNKVPCIVSTGCWPGVSSLMAKQLISKIQEETNEPADKLSVNFSFFTAGSGGAGVTLLVATFLILAEKALVVVNGRRRPVEPMCEYSTIDFGPEVGPKDVAHLNLLETASIAENLGVANVHSLFGTAPNFWNALLGLMAKLPPSLLSNEPVMRKLSVFSMPIVRIVDHFAGATNAMRCDVTTTDGKRASAIYAHRNLEPCVGECVVAFCIAILSGVVKEGVHFPEQAIASDADRAAVLHAASVGAHTTVVESEGLDLKHEEIWGSPNKRRVQMVADISA